MITAITGNNTYTARQRLRELVNKFVKQYGDLAVEKFDGEEVELQPILDAIQNLPFLAQRKMVVVRSMGNNKVLAEQIEQIISSVSETTDLIFYEPLTDKRTTFHKILKSNTEFEEFNELEPSSLAKWLVVEAKSRRGELSRADANYLIQRLGPNQELLASELEKLIVYNPKITRENIELLTDPTPQSKIFDLLDTAFSGQKAQALKIYDDQRAQKVDPSAILAMLAWQLNILTLCKLAGDRKPGQIAKDAGVSPFPVMKASGLAKKIDEAKLKSMVRGALEMDYKAKTKTYNLDEALKTFIVTM